MGEAAQHANQDKIRLRSAGVGWGSLMGGIRHELNWNSTWEI